VEVPTLFFSERLSFGSIRSIDILPTALGILGISWRGGDGKDIRKKTPLIGKSYFPGFHSRWRFNKNNGFELSTTELEEREFGKEISNSLSFCISSTQRFWSMLTRACIYYLNKRRHREAERWFKRALLLEGVPSSSKAFAFHQLGELYLSLGDYEKAEEEFCKLFLLKGPQISWKTFLIRRLRDIYLAKGRKEELQDRFREYSLLKGVDEIFKGTVLLELGELYLSQGRHEDALRKFTECILMKNITLSLRATAYYKRGSLYEKAGFLSQARKDFQEVLCILRDDNLHQANELIGGAHFHMGRIYQRMCRLEDARREFERCLRIIPRHMKAKEALCIYANQAKITKRLRFLGYL
jgi:tetratricopeptide (TPR) repeat protein